MCVLLGCWVLVAKVLVARLLVARVLVARGTSRSATWEGRTSICVCGRVEVEQCFVCAGEGVRESGVGSQGLGGLDFIPKNELG